MSKKLAKNNVFNEVHKRMDLKQQLMYICVVAAIIVLLAGYVMNKVIKNNPKVAIKIYYFCLVIIKYSF